MYKNLTIKNFRGFRAFRIEQLAQINLFAGANNVGKTSLLEAIFLHQGPDNSRLELQVNIFRGAEEFGSDPDEIWGTLFWELDTNTKISISTEDTQGIQRILDICLSPLDSIKFPIKNKEKDENNIRSKAISDKMLELKFSENGKTMTSALAFPIQDGISLERKKPVDRPIGHYIGARQRIRLSENTSRFSKLVKDKAEEKLIENLRIIEPRLKNLKILSPGTKPMIWADLGEKSLLPLYALGDGIDRLLSIVLAIANASGGIVLVDEIENGIYYKSMAKVWKTIFELARDYNVQIFATTHSNECICSANKAFKNIEPKYFKFFRLERQAENILPVEYDRDTLDSAIKLNLEVR